jgi:hypothetical protein
MSFLELACFEILSVLAVSRGAQNVGLLLLKILITLCSAIFPAMLLRWLLVLGLC